MESEADDPEAARAEQLLDDFLTASEEGGAASLSVFLAERLPAPEQGPLRERVRGLCAAMRRLDALQARAGLGPVDTEAAFHAAASRRVEAILEALAGYRPTVWPYGPETPIGQGGLGEVSATVEHSTGRRLALKRPRLPVQSEPTARNVRLVSERLLEESRILARLEHPAIPPLHARTVDDLGRPYFSMRLVEGEDLTEAIGDAHGAQVRWTVLRLVEALRTVCDAVAHAHARGVIHRDLKPDNIRVGPGGQTYVLDWGLARDVHRRTTIRSATDGLVHDEDDLAAALTGKQETFGTPSYMPPEQSRGGMREVDERSDVFALGAILFHVLCGRPPAVEPRPSPTTTPGLRKSAPALVAICAKAMQPEKGDRYPSATGMAADLTAYLEQRVVSAHRTGPVAELLAWSRRNRVAASMVTLVLVVVIVSAVGLATVYGELASAYASLQAQTARTQLSMAEAARQRGDSQTVVELLQDGDALRSDPGLAVPVLAEALLTMGETTRAKALLEGASSSLSEEAPERGSLLLQMAHAQMASGNLQAARTILDEALEYPLSPGDEALATAWLMEDAGAATSLLRTSVARDPFRFVSRSQLAVQLLFTDPDEARGHFEILATLFPDQLSPRLGVALASCFEGDFAGARESALGPWSEAHPEHARTVETVISLLELVEGELSDWLTTPTADEMIAALVTKAPPLLLALESLPPNVLRQDTFHPSMQAYVFAIGSLFRALWVDPTEGASPGRVEALEQTFLEIGSVDPGVREATASFLQYLALLRITFDRTALRTLDATSRRRMQLDMVSALADASERPSLVPGVQAAGRVWLVSVMEQAARTVTEWPSPDRDRLVGQYRRFADWACTHASADTVWDDAALVRVGLLLGDHPRADRCLDWLREHAPTSIDRHRLECDLALARGSPVAAIAACRAWQADFPGNREAAQRLAQAEERALAATEALRR